jgi:hypothetical protein
LLILSLLSDALEGPLVGIIGLAVIFIVYFGIRARIKQKRFDTPALCTWTYTAEEWRRHADTFGLSETPNGPAQVRITPTDILIFDSGRRLRKELDAWRKCVTACKFERGVLSFRVRWYYRRRQPKQKVLFFYDLHLPVPIASEADARMIVEYFNKQIAENPAKVRDVTPQESGRAIFGEPNF